MGKRVKILQTGDGDWEGIYIDGKLISQGHRLGEGDWRMFMLKMAEGYHFKSSDVSESELTPEDDAEVMDMGDFPIDINTLSGTY